MQGAERPFINAAKPETAANARGNPETVVVVHNPQGQYRLKTPSCYCSDLALKTYQKRPPPNQTLAHPHRPMTQR
jgi:hypothetical protein